MPATVGTARMAAQAASRRVMSFCWAWPTHQARLEGEGEHFAHGVDVLLHPVYVIGDVTEKRPHLGGDRQHLGVLQPTADVDEWHNGVAQVKQVPAKRVEALDVAPDKLPRQHAVLDLLRLGPHRLQDRPVVVDDEIQGGVEDVILILAVRQGSWARLAQRAHGRVTAR
jgi:hypothetical protein